MVQEQVAVAEEDAAFADPGGEAEALFIREAVDGGQQVVLAEDDVLELVRQGAFGADDQRGGIEDGVIDAHVVEGLDADDVAGVLREDVLAVDGVVVDVSALLDGPVAQDGGTLPGEPLVIDVERDVGRQQGKGRDGDGDDAGEDTDAEEGAVPDEAEDDGEQNGGDEHAQGGPVRVVVGGVVRVGVFHESGLVEDLGVVGHDGLFQHHAAGNFQRILFPPDDFGAVHLDAAVQEPQVVEHPAEAEVAGNVAAEDREAGRGGEQGDRDAGGLRGQAVDEFRDEVREHHDGDGAGRVQAAAEDAEDTFDDGGPADGGGHDEDAGGHADGQQRAAAEGLQVVPVRGQDAREDQADDGEDRLDDDAEEGEPDFAFQDVFEALAVLCGVLVFVVQIISDVGVVLHEALIAKGMAQVFVDDVRVEVQRFFFPFGSLRLVRFAAVELEALDAFDAAFPEHLFGGVFVHLLGLEFELLVVEPGQFDLTVYFSVFFVFDGLGVALRNDGLVKRVELRVRGNDLRDGLEVRGVRDLAVLGAGDHAGDAVGDFGGLLHLDHFGGLFGDGLRGSLFHLFPADRCDGSGGSGGDRRAGGGHGGVGALRRGLDIVAGGGHLFVFHAGELRGGAFYFGR